MLKLRESVFGRAIEENSGQKKKKCYKPRSANSFQLTKRNTN